MPKPGQKVTFKTGSTPYSDISLLGDIPAQKPIKCPKCFKYSKTGQCPTCTTFLINEE